MLSHCKAQAMEDSSAQSLSICQQVLKLEVVQRAKRIALYVSIGAEVDTTLLHEKLLERGCLLVYPRIHEGSLIFIAADSLDQMIAGPYGTREPRYSSFSLNSLNRQQLQNQRQNERHQVPLNTIDVMVVPGVAFTLAGQRLGRGKGFYDKALAGMSSKVSIGLAYACQIISDLPCEPHDQPVDIVISGSAPENTDQRRAKGI